MHKNKIGKVSSFTACFKTFLCFFFLERPDKPEITGDIKEHVCDVTIEWSKPSSNGCPILFYTIRYKEQKAYQDANDWEEINVTDPSTNQRELKLKCSTTYEFQVVASNEIGKSLPSTVRSATTRGDTTQKVLYEGKNIYNANFLAMGKIFY